MDEESSEEYELKENGVQGTGREGKDVDKERRQLTIDDVVKMKPCKQICHEDEFSLKLLVPDVIRS